VKKNKLNIFSERLSYTFYDIFPDLYLAAYIATIFNRQPEDQVTLEELNNLTTILSLSNQGISSLEGIQHLSSITQLNLNGNSICQLNPLNGLKSLTHLNLSMNQIKDLEPLRNLNNLWVLHLDNNQIEDIEPLSALINLTNLTLKTNQMTQIDPLKELVNLSHLDVSFNKIMSLEPLKKLVNLTDLYIQQNIITDLEPLSEMKNLSLIHMQHNRVTDFSPLSNLPSLRQVIAIGQSIELEAIAEGESTKNIKIRLINGETPELFFFPEGGTYNPESGTITWAGPGYNLFNWWEKDLEHRYVDITGNVSQHIYSGMRFIDFFPDENLAQAVAELFGRIMTDIVSIRELNDLTVTLNANNRNISNIEGMQHLIGMSQVYLDQNNIEDLEPLRELNKLHFLSLSENKISNIEPISELYNLVHLDIRHNQLTNNQIKPLVNLTSLELLLLDFNQITDLSSLSNINEALAISAFNQKVTLAPTTPGILTEEIYLLTVNGQVPSSITFNPVGGVYIGTGGIIIWPSAGENTLIWTDTNFSGTISQLVQSVIPSD